MSIANISGGDPYRGDRSEHAEEEIIEIYQRPSLAEEGVHVVALDTLREAAVGFLQPVAPQYVDLNLQDENGYCVRYEIPRVTHYDYQNSISCLSGYRCKCVCLFRHDPKIGCYVEITLGKTREQYEDDYKKICQELNCEKHAIWTKDPKNWWTVLERTLNPEGYQRDSQERRDRQLEGIEKVVEYWENQNLFEKVFALDTRYRADVLEEYPESIAANDVIVLVYKRVSPVIHLWTATSWDGLLRPIRSMRSLQADRRFEADEANRPLYQKALRKVTESFPSIPWLQRTSQPPVEDRASSPPAEPPLEERPAGSSRSSGFLFFFRDRQFLAIPWASQSVSRAVRGVWDWISGWFSALRNVGAGIAASVVRSKPE